ncbi:methyltransferase domain-containing protein [Catellatospora citrea]|uniref:methyltransferase domain-containing protein n=1 Tax=Catellatospora citrea TaxID=53366 RepID=UPI0033C71CE4
MTSFTPAATAAPDPIQYLDAVARTPVGLDYKQRLVDLLRPQAGQTVLDIGCGPGTDLSRLADAVTGTGTVIGVDDDPGMVAEARRRLAHRPVVEVRRGDAHRLPLADASVDRAKVDRVLQHLADPGRAMAEARRVLRRGGVFAMAEPDWDTLTVADEDVETSRCFARFTAGQVRNATIGSRLVSLAAQAGFGIGAVEATVALYRDFQAADQVLGLRRNTARAVRDGVMADEVARQWLARLEDGPFLAGFTFYLVTAEA